MNEHIENYCIEYIESDFNPQFAILLKGEWGCGKTYFIKKLISKYSRKEQKIQRNEIIYLSLFGISNTSEIDERLYQKMHPVLSSEQFKFITTFLRAAIKMGVNIDLNGDGIKNGTLTIGGLESKRKKIKSKELSKKLIIVDDIERANLSSSQIFGYFSEYLYELNLKIIFIGNEDIIPISDNEKDNYLKIKEKTIGVEFTIKPEIDYALSCFINEFSLNNIENIRDNCLEVISILNCKNLRTVRQCLYNLKLFFLSLNNEIIKKNNNELSRIFIILFIQKSLNIISDKNHIRDAIVGFDEHKMNYLKYIELKKEKQWIFDYYRKYIPLSSLWSDIIFDGDYSKQKINEIYQQEEESKKITKQKNLFVLIGDWRSMNSCKFKEMINTVNKELENGVYLHPGELLHYANIMIIFCEWKLIEGTRLELINKVKEIIEKIKEKIIPVDDWGMIDIGYAGWAFSNEVSEVKEMRNYLMKISNENLYKTNRDIINNEIKLIKNNVHAFCQNISHIKGNGKYNRIPYLSLVDINAFFNELINLSIDNQSLIITFFEERYGIIYNSYSLINEYKADKDNLKKLSALYDGSLSDIEYNPPEFLKRDISERLHKLMDYFDKNCITPVSSQDTP